jgi:hypothetical protein
MNRIPPLSFETATLLQNSLERLHNYIDIGYDPNDALEKTAKDFDLLPKQIELVSYAYNNGIINFLTEDPNERIFHHKAAKLVDPKKVIDKLYPNQIKKGNARKDESISSFYFMRPSEHFYNQVGKYTKKSSLVSILPDEISEESLERELKTLLDKEKRNFEQIKTARLQIQDQLASLYDSLYEYFNRVDAIDPEEVVKNASYLYPNISKLFQFIKKGNREYCRGVPVDWNHEPYSLIKRIYSLLDKYSYVNQEFKIYQEKFASLEKKLGFKKESNLKKNCLSKEKLEKTGEAGKSKGGIKIKSVHDILSSSAKAIGDVLPSTKVKSIFQPLSVEKITGSEAVQMAIADSLKVTLIDLMLNDPIISNYDPEDVYKAFVKVIQIAPTASTRSETLRILLRKILTAETLEEKDIIDMTKMEYELNRLKQLSRKE